MMNNISKTSDCDVLDCYPKSAMEEYKMAGMDKITRILLMYSKISQGGRIYKRSFCMETGIDRRTFDRDIEDIRL